MATAHTVHAGRGTMDKPLTLVAPHPFTSFAPLNGNPLGVIVDGFECASAALKCL